MQRRWYVQASDVLRPSLKALVFGLGVSGLGVWGIGFIGITELGSIGLRV